MILKDPNGKPCGYLIQEEDRMICSCRAESRGRGMIVFIASNGEERKIMVDLGREETIRLREGEKVELAYIEKNGELICATSEIAALRFRSGLVEPNDEETKKRSDNQQVKMQERLAASNWLSETEGRWPPPPCKPGARYRSGRWQLGQVDDC